MVKIRRKWSGKTGGTSWMQRALIRIYKMVGLRPMYLITALVIPFYMLFAREGYLSAYRFFRKRMKYGQVRSFVSVYRNHYTFGQIVLDRFAVYAGKKFNLDIEGYDIFQKMANEPDGFMMLSSHIGNYELAGYSLVSGKKPFNALVYAEETETVMNNRQRILGHNNIRLIPIKSDMSHIYSINNALADGEILSMSGDRIFGSSKVANCIFFGETAKFPLGPFVVATQRGVRMLAVFVMKTNIDSYHIYIKEIKAEEGLKMRDRMNNLAQKFANELEIVLRKHPTQWFNYYDFWA